MFTFWPAAMQHFHPRKILHLTFLLSVALPGFGARAEDFSARYAGLGELIVTQFQSAPFPHPQRAEGHTYKEKLFPAGKHYSDSTVAIFIPKKFHETESVDFVIHFHGWFNHVENVFSQYQLAGQLIEANRNAILVIPEGPKDAPDSFGGKLEDADGFKKFMAEVLQTLRARGKLQKSEIGRIILSGHSGGYRVISAILDRGGITDRIKEVWLFDALYGQTEKFTNWFGRPDIRFLNIYTENGGTKKETENLMADLKKQNTPFLATTENQIWPQQLQTNKLIFLFTELAHNDVLNKHRTFREFLSTSCLADTKANAFVPPPKRDVPGLREKISLGELYVPDFFKASVNGTNDLVLFFHGAAWCAEQNFCDARKNAVLVSISHSNYAALFADTKKFPALLDEITRALAKRNVSSHGIGKICLASFSGGYPAVREILKHAEFRGKISDVVLADSLYALRANGKSNQLDSAALAPFLDFARRAADGRCTFWFSHLFPPEEKYRDNTTTLAANYLIKQLHVERRDANARNSRGVRILYRADKGNFHVLGYAGMTNQDHFEHFYGLSDLLREISFDTIPPEPAKQN